MAYARPSAFVAPTALALGLLLALGAVPASALSAADFAPPSSLMAGENPYISTDPATETSLVVALDPDNGDIIGRLFNDDLVPLGAAFPISESGSSNETPTAEWDSENNQWLVVWNDDAEPSTVQGRLVALNGTFVTSQFLIADAGVGSSTFFDSELSFASYAADQDGFLVAFKTTLLFLAAPDCEVAMVSWVGDDGTVPTTVALTVSSDDPENACAQIDNGADLAYSSDDSEWLVSWWDNNTDSTVARRVGTGATPTLLGAAFIIGANTSDASSDVAYDPTRNQMLVGWHTPGAVSRDAVGGLVTAADVVTPTTIAVSTADLDWRRPSMVYTSSTDKFFAALHDNDSDAGVGVYLVQINAATGVAEERILLEAGMVRPSISTDGECLWVVWSDNDSDVRGVSTCTPPTLAATGAEAAPLAAVGVLALLLGAVGIAVSRRRSVNEA